MTTPHHAPSWGHSGTVARLQPRRRLGGRGRAVRAPEAMPDNTSRAALASGLHRPATSVRRLRNEQAELGPTRPALPAVASD